MVNALTVDLEDYFHVTAFERRIARHQWDQFPSRVEANTQRLLDIFARHQVHATFFVLGWIAERFPALIRAIADAGHEIACHSYWHRLVYQLTPDEFRADLREARAVIEDAVGESVVAFRAPSWSITRDSLWALDILAEEGFHYDSSIFPIFHDRYGIPNARRQPHRLNGAGAGLWEFPGSVVRAFRINLPVSGGGYFRLYPVSWSARFLRRINQKHGEPFMFYIHPWELDPDQPRVCSPWRAWRHYVNLSTTASKLEYLLQRFTFGRMDDVLNQYAAIHGEPAPTQFAPIADHVSECA
jgi:polysaccharide deacetylase family protein (PEP-CTERM system associated)